MKLSRFLWLPLVLLLGWAWVSFGSSSHARVSPAEAHSLVQSGARLVDVRASFEFTAGHIPGAVNVPVQQLQQRMVELEPKDKPIVVYCRSGHRSQLAFEQLKAAGFSRLYDLGPMSAW